MIHRLSSALIAIMHLNWIRYRYLQVANAAVTHLCDDLAFSVSISESIAVVLSVYTTEQPDLP